LKNIFITCMFVVANASAAELLPRPWGDSYLPKSKAPARHVYAVRLHGLKTDERLALTCLQGLIAREQPGIWLLRNSEDQFWLDRHKELGFIGDYEFATNWPSLFEKYASVCKGAVIPDDKFYRGDLIAANVAACEDAVVASPELAKRLKLEIKRDLRGSFTNYTDGLRWVWTNYQARLNPQLCDFRQPELLAHCTFDYSYEWRALMFWIAGKKDGANPGADPAAEKKLAGEILASMKPNGVCVGFPAGGEHCGIGEPQGVELLSRHGYALVCNNHMVNCSMLSSVAVAPFRQKEQPPAPALETNKIYIALVLSDGDNEILWPGFFKRYFEHPSFGKFPLAFGMGPAIREMQPGIAAWYFEHATPTTEFIADVSGAGYMQPDHFVQERANGRQVWDDFLGWSARLMQECGMKSVRTVGGGDSNVVRYAEAMPFCHSIFADMGRYSGRTGITNLTYRLPGGMPVFRAATGWHHGKAGFLQEIREQVGSSRPAFVNGFLHCWTFGMDDLARICRRHFNKAAVACTGAGGPATEGRTDQRKGSGGKEER